MQPASTPTSSHGRPSTSSQLVGMAMARHVIAVEPLAALSGEELAALLAPTLQRCLVGELRRS